MRDVEHHANVLAGYLPSLDQIASQPIPPVLESVGKYSQEEFRRMLRQYAIRVGVQESGIHYFQDAHVVHEPLRSRIIDTRKRKYRTITQVAALTKGTSNPYIIDQVARFPSWDPIRKARAIRYALGRTEMPGIIVVTPHWGDDEIMYRAIDRMPGDVSVIKMWHPVEFNRVSAHLYDSLRSM